MEWINIIEQKPTQYSTVLVTDGIYYCVCDYSGFNSRFGYNMFEINGVYGYDYDHDINLAKIKYWAILPEINNLPKTKPMQIETKYRTGEEVYTLLNGEIVKETIDGVTFEETLYTDKDEVKTKNRITYRLGKKNPPMIREEQHIWLSEEDCINDPQTEEITVRVLKQPKPELTISK